MKIVVCDDEAVFRNTLIEHISTYKDAKYEVVAYSSGEEVLRHIDEKDIYAYILDIELGGMNGIELAKHIRKKDLFVPIIYTTSYTSFAIDAFEVTAFRYINKPIIKESLHRVLKQLDEYTGQNNRKLIISNRHESISLYYRDIIYIDVSLRVVGVHTMNKTYHHHMTLKDVENDLKGDMFVKISKNCIINIEHIAELTKKDMEMNNGDILYVSRSFSKAFKEKYMEFVIKMSEQFSGNENIKRKKSYYITTHVEKPACYANGVEKRNKKCYTNSGGSINYRDSIWHLPRLSLRAL